MTYTVKYDEKGNIAYVMVTLADGRLIEIRPDHVMLWRRGPNEHVGLMESNEGLRVAFIK